jgi:hypothetical protein
MRSTICVPAFKRIGITCVVLAVAGNLHVHGVLRIIADVPPDEEPLAPDMNRGD